MRLIDKDINIIACVAVLICPFKLVNHRQNQAALVGLQKLLQCRLTIGAPGGDILLLHFAEQSFDPAFHLAFELGAVDNYDDSGVPEPLLLFENEPRRGEQRESLARALGMPDKTSILRGICTALQDRVDRAALMLA